MIEPSKNLGRSMALAQCGVEMVLPMLLGVLLDNWFGIMPWLTIIFLILGFIGGLTHIVILSNQIAKTDEEERKAKQNGPDPT